MSVFSISPKDGTLSFLEIFPAGGSYARQFALNKGGNLAAVGLQQTGSVSILERDLTSGVFEREVASIAIGDGQVVCVVWDE
jgi:6-phosphogluconolactonase (cycloisomerase 2 family)